MVMMKASNVLGSLQNEGAMIMRIMKGASTPKGSSKYLYGGILEQTMI